MSTKPLKIPKQLRVTFQERKEHLYDEDGTHTGFDEYLLGYAAPYAPTTVAGRKSKESQDDWAYSLKYTKTSSFKEDENGKMWKLPGRWETQVVATTTAPFQERTSVWVNDEPIIYPDNVQPIIIDNEPLEGFKIDHMISRYRGNKLWRIIDPRGFQLEITSGCLEDLIFSGMVDKGLIIGACVWRTGKILQRV